MKEKEEDPERALTTLRIRMRRRMLNRIKAVVAFDRERIGENWGMSDGLREIILPWLERREREILDVREAGVFSAGLSLGREGG